MVRLLSAGIDCFSSVVFILPAVLLLQPVYKRQNMAKFFMVLIFACYSMAVFSLVGVPTITTLRVDFSFNLIPLIDIFNSPVEYIKNTILNVLLFMPMGFLLPVIWKNYRSIKKTVFTGLAVSIMIELLQIFTFRLTDIDDLITNTFGTFLGYECGKRFSFRLPWKMQRNHKNTSVKYEPVVILAAVLLIAFFLKPLVSNAVWTVVLSSPLWESMK